jgi:hypothetical protein
MQNNNKKNTCAKESFKTPWKKFIMLVFLFC